ncbi:hypothetical protein GCM10010466_19390 [Planomonospora alba]|uniref:Uncharacterized protein n=1 Tax=Planomonospora alba TaxID=161354 RepID=A0ABP6MXY1_9ACTN
MARSVGTASTCPVCRLGAPASCADSAVTSPARSVPASPDPPAGAEAAGTGAAPLAFSAPPQAAVSNARPARGITSRGPYRNVVMSWETEAFPGGFCGTGHDAVTFPGRPGRGTIRTGPRGRYGQESWKGSGAMWWWSAAGSPAWPRRGTCGRATRTYG